MIDGNHAPVIFNGENMIVIVVVPEAKPSSTLVNWEPGKNSSHDSDATG